MDPALLRDIVVRGQGQMAQAAENPELRATISMGESLDTKVRRSPVDSVYLHGAMSGEVIHWRLFCPLLENKRQSVEINSQQLQYNDGENVNTTRLFIIHRPYDQSKTFRRIGSVRFAFTAADVSVQKIIDLLVRENQRDRYLLTEGGSGCLFWCLTVLGDMESKGWVAGGTKVEAEKWLDVLRATQDPRHMPWPPQEGRFY